MSGWRGISLCFCFSVGCGPLQAVAVTCIDGWKSGNGIGGTEVLATGQTLTKEACAEKVQNGNVPNCSSANGATQKAFGGCYCEIGMDDLVDNTDGTMTCLFSGSWKLDPGAPMVVIPAIVGCVLLLCCCLCSYVYCSSEKGYLLRQRLMCQNVGDEEEEIVVEDDILLVTPDYWKNQDMKKNFDGRHPPTPEMKKLINKMLVQTFKDVQTRDRQDGRIPQSLKMMECIQVENRDQWLKYLKGKARIQRKRPGGLTPVGGPANLSSLASQKGEVMMRSSLIVDGYDISSKNTKKKAKKNPFRGQADKSVADAKNGCRTSSISKRVPKLLDDSVNEYFLFHGTTPEGAFGILESGFKLSFVGSHRGTMFGRGCYFAECSSKSDEYAKSGSGQLQNVYGMLVCRVACGELFRVLKSDLKSIEQAIACGFYDGVFGDREASVGTYREYVVFTEDVIYPEFIVLYQREYPTE